MGAFRKVEVSFWRQSLRIFVEQKNFAMTSHHCLADFKNFVSLEA